MSIRRAPRPETGFTLIRDAVLRDDRLSYRARGILVSILSRPDNWVTNADQLAEEGKEGRDAIRAAMKELEVAGYIERQIVQDSRGRWGTQTLVFDTPQNADSQSPETENQSSENPPSVSQALKKENLEEQPTNGKQNGKPATLPQGWAPNLKARNYASENGIDVDHEAGQFTNHHGSKGSRFVDWDLAFRTWLGNAKKWGRVTVPERPQHHDGRPEGW